MDGVRLWFGGVWMFKLDPTTGLRDYTATYETVENQSDAYYGIKVAGGFGNSGEGAYLAHANGHWYLFLSYGHLQQTGGYQSASSAPTQSPAPTWTRPATRPSPPAPKATTGRETPASA